MKKQTIAILGCGNLGLALLRGMLKSLGEEYNFIVTRRNTALLKKYEAENVKVTDDNAFAVQNADVVILTFKPYNILRIAGGLKEYFRKDQLVISMATGITLESLKSAIGEDVPMVRAMPNTAADVRQSITCVVYEEKYENEVQPAYKILSSIGEVIKINEELMEAATVLGACGIAYVLRFIRAMVQGGIQIGFDAVTAAKIVNHTVKGAAQLLLDNNTHPEAEIDKVTTPKGCTIVGLNEMEHNGFSSSLIKGINSSYKDIKK